MLRGFLKTGLPLLAIIQLGLFLFFISLSARAQDMTSYGAGNSTCQFFLELHGVQDKNAADQARGIYFAWAQGYVSALNLMLGSQEGMFANLKPQDFSTDEQFSFLLEWCANHRLEPFKHAALELMNEIRLRNGLPIR